MTEAKIKWYVVGQRGVGRTYLSSLTHSREKINNHRPIQYSSLTILQYGPLRNQYNDYTCRQAIGQHEFQNSHAVSDLLVCGVNAQNDLPALHLTGSHNWYSTCSTIPKGYCELQPALVGLQRRGTLLRFLLVFSGLFPMGFFLGFSGVVFPMVFYFLYDFFCHSFCFSAFLLVLHFFFNLHFASSYLALPFFGVFQIFLLNFPWACSSVSEVLSKHYFYHWKTLVLSTCSSPCREAWLICSERRVTCGSCVYA